MGTYGRNIDFRIPPDGDERYGRYAVPSTGSKLPIGVPVRTDVSAGRNALGLQLVELANGEMAPPKAGAGILLYEYGPAGFAGVDSNLVTYSDMDTVPLGSAVQVVHHPGIRVVFTNTSNTAYPDFSATFQSGPRVMVQGMGATPTVAVGNYLTPSSVSNDTVGYYMVTATASNAWFVVVRVDSVRQEVEAEMVF